jgi:hypothetical protein
MTLLSRRGGRAIRALRASFFFSAQLAARSSELLQLLHSDSA